MLALRVDFRWAFVILVYHARLFSFSSTPHLVIADLLVWPRFVLPDLAVSFWSVVWPPFVLHKTTFCLIWHRRFDRTCYGLNWFYAAFAILLGFAWFGSISWAVLMVFVASHFLFVLCISFLCYSTFCFLLTFILFYFISCRRSAIGDLAWRKFSGRSIFA